MDIVRVIKSKDYTTICNRIFKDKRLSLKAKGLLAMLLSFSDSWKLNIKGLVTILKEGESAIRSTMNELITFNYVERQQIKNEKGIIIGIDYTVYESPLLNKPQLENPHVDNKSLLNNNIIKNKLYKGNNKIIFFNEVFSFKKYDKNLLKEFYEYWSEPTKKGQMRKDLQKTWSTERRLKTWAKNESKWALKSVGISKVDKHLQTHNEAMQILKQIQDNDKKNK
tara:strand:+ start:6694 stop:7365 length:672 start_codon:yes stop_codon:yes gene_type:complete